LHNEAFFPELRLKPEIHIVLLAPPPILIAEDEPFVALDLALAVKDAGGIPVGPAGSVREALELLASTQVAAAILDVNLSDGDVFPVLEVLMGRGVPVIVQTGLPVPLELRSRYPGLTVLAKPIEAAVLLAKLKALLAGGRDDARGS
jgi:DNA-binding response OmpR family regulator